MCVAYFSRTPLILHIFFPEGIRKERSGKIASERSNLRGWPTRAVPKTEACL